MISTILLPTDGSPAAGVAERFGVSLAAQLKARLLGLSVIEDRFARGLQEDGLGVPASAARRAGGLPEEPRGRGLPAAGRASARGGRRDHGRDGLRASPTT